MDAEQDKARQHVWRMAGLLEVFAESLTGGKLTGQSVVLGTNKRYTTLAREYAKDARKAVPNKPLA